MCWAQERRKGSERLVWAGNYKMRRKRKQKNKQARHIGVVCKWGFRWNVIGVCNAGDDEKKRNKIINRTKWSRSTAAAVTCSDELMHFVECWVIDFTREMEVSEVASGVRKKEAIEHWEWRSLVWLAFSFGRFELIGINKPSRNMFKQSPSPIPPPSNVSNLIYVLFEMGV